MALKTLEIQLQEDIDHIFVFGLCCNRHVHRRQVLLVISNVVGILEFSHFLKGNKGFYIFAPAIA